MKGDFSQRMGFRPLKPEIQLEGINYELLNSLWNVLFSYYLNRYSPKVGSTYRRVEGSNRHNFARGYYWHFKKMPIDQIETNWIDFLANLREDFFSYKWHRVYSFVEFILAYVEERFVTSIIQSLNLTLERENSGYRLIDGTICPITSQEEIASVEEALKRGSVYQGIGEHLSSAIRMLSDKQNPDYRNSIKESISAVESVVRHVTGETSATLGQALKILEKTHALHPALKTAFQNLYGYTNDANGIRHSLMDNENKLTNADARFMLITCSAFINFTIDSMRE
jgi:hypothetical protein